MTKTILCATDFSDSSREAVRWAIAIARQLKTHLTILYTYRLTKSLNGEAVKMKKKIEEDASRNFEIMEKELLTAQDVSYDFKSEVGFVLDRVEDHVKNTGVRFLVMDRNMSAGNKEIFDDLIKHIQVPLVIVP